MNLDETFAITAAIIVLGALILLLYIFWAKNRKKSEVSRALNLVLFLVTVPRYAPKQKDDLSEEGEEAQGAAALMEHFYETLGGLSSEGKSGIFSGSPYMAFEMAVHHIGEEIHFYVAVPHAFASGFEKRVHGAYPAAHIERVKDYNIFAPEAFALGAIGRLSKDPTLPIQTYEELKFDTLDQLTTALSKISYNDEGAAIQLLIRPARSSKIRKRAEKIMSLMREGKSFSKALSEAKKKESFFNSVSEVFQTKSGKKDEIKERVSEADEEIVRVIRAKAAKEAFEVNLRILVSAKEEKRAKELLSEIKGAFEEFNAPYANEISFSDVSRGALKDLVFRFSFRIFSPSSILYLSSSEIASLFHFPLGGVAAPRVKYLKARPVEPPTNLARQGVILGKNIFRGVETVVRMSDDDRRRHLYIIGQTGTGKSSFMKRMVSQDIGEGKGVCVIDPHGDFADYALGQVPPERIDDVIYFNPGESQRVLGLNMLEFDPKNPEQKTFIVNELLKIFDKLYDLRQTGGPLFEQYFRNAVLLVMDDAANEPPTFASVSRVLADSAYRKDKLSRENNPLVREFWQEQAEKAGGEAALSNMVPYITSKFDQFLSNDFMRPIVNQPHSSFDFRKVMDEKKILIVNLSKGRIGDLNANLLGMIIVGRLLMAALSRVDSPESERSDFYLYIDEFQNFTTDSIATILSEARKYRLDLIVAHQFIKQLPENIRDAVFGNVGSMVSFRVGAEDAEVLEKQFLPTVTAHDLSDIDNFNSYARLLINNQTSRPFNIQMIREDEENRERARQVREISLSRYGRPRDEVEREIRQSYEKAPKAQELAERKDFF